MRYNVNFCGKDCDNENYSMSGTVEITESKCFQYGNGKVMKFDVADKEKGYSHTDIYDIRYDTRYKSGKETEYIKQFVKDNFAQVIDNLIIIEACE